jgi:glycosyltransferase involved in cell wall biosynthesis
MFRLAKAMVFIMKRQSEFVVFYHMTERVGGILSLFFRVARVRQVLWYSHSKVNIWLRLSALFCDYVYSPTPQSFPLKHKELRTMGHGISDKYSRLKPFEHRTKNKVLYLGRISRIKNIESLVIELEKVNSLVGNRFEIDVAGPVLDEVYWSEIKELATNLSVGLNYLGIYSRNTIPDLLNQYRYTYTGNPATIDKAAVEAMFCGCMVLTNVKALWEHLHLNEVNPGIANTDQIPSIEEQLRVFILKEEQSICSLEKVAIKVRRENSLDRLVSDISIQLKKIS